MRTGNSGSFEIRQGFSGILGMQGGNEQQYFLRMLL